MQTLHVKPLPSVVAALVALNVVFVFYTFSRGGGIAFSEGGYVEYTHVNAF